MSPHSMTVVEYDRFGGPEVLTLRERPVPTPAPHQLLVRVAASGLNPKEILIRAGKFRLLSGRRFPRRTGFDWAGEVVSRGAAVHDIALGTRLFGMLNGWQGGAAAEYLLVEPAHAAEVPTGLGLVEASALPLASLTAIQVYRDLAQLRPGQRVLVNGGAGGVGTFAIQIARALGAEVDATASAANHALLRTLGAAETYDYRTLDLRALAGRYDVVFDVFGNLPFARVRPLLRPHGAHVTTVFKPSHLRDRLALLGSRQRTRLAYVKASRRDLTDIARFVAEGKLRPVIDRIVPLAEIADAHRHLGTRHARGKVIVRITAS